MSIQWIVQITDVQRKEHFWQVLQADKRPLVGRPEGTEHIKELNVCKRIMESWWESCSQSEQELHKQQRPSEVKASDKEQSKEADPLRHSTDDILGARGEVRPEGEIVPRCGKVPDISWGTGWVQGIGLAWGWSKNNWDSKTWKVECLSFCNRQECPPHDVSFSCGLLC